MLAAQFVQFQSLRLEDPADGNGRCAVLREIEGRCRTSISLDAFAEIQELHEKLANHDASDEVDRAGIIERIARLRLCENHIEEDKIAAAVLQWTNDMNLPAAVIAAPRTPMSKNSNDQIEFENYTTPKSKTNPHNPIHIDRKIRSALARKIEDKGKQVGHVYVFSYKRAKGKFKIGHGQELTRVTEDHARCYPGLELHCFAECPNARLVEGLVHEELRQFRRTHKCLDCPNNQGKDKMHTEWFEAPLKDILDSVTAWSLYARMFYTTGVSVDGTAQHIPREGFSTRDDRWRRWALAETMRWMDGKPLRGSAIPDPYVPPEPNVGKALDDSASEASSVFSDGGRSDTPGTTPGITPLMDPESAGDKRDYYSLSPAPARRRTSSGNLLDEVKDEDEYDLDGIGKPLNRALFKASDKRPQSRRETSRADSNKDTGSNALKLIDHGVRSVLKDIPNRPVQPGTVYLVTHPTEKASKMSLRHEGSRREKRLCKLEPSLMLECTNMRAIQDLVLAEFGDKTDRYACGMGRCQTAHLNWIKAPEEDIEASLRAWKALFEVGYETIDLPPENFSQGADRWRRWAIETAEKRKNEGKGGTETKPPTGSQRPSLEDPFPFMRAATSFFAWGNDSKGGGRGGARRLLQRVKDKARKKGGSLSGGSRDRR
ncbi:GIY-YIG nuclease family protein [Aspergillus lucknowensis]|uniref:Bacteriophage T5 Orf172 DNA-binding domain-containing protein n=1 Tax=Aspergillus lucknowensis TaxID=176173 RepID=A0ABR4LWW8_9EURO